MITVSYLIIENQIVSNLVLQILRYKRDIASYIRKFVLYNAHNIFGEVSTSMQVHIYLHEPLYSSNKLLCYVSNG